MNLPDNKGKIIILLNRLILSARKFQNVFKFLETLFSMLFFLITSRKLYLA